MSNSADDPFAAQIRVSDGAGNELTTKEASDAWNATVTVPTSNSKLPWEILVHFSKDVDPPDDMNVDTSAMTDTAKELIARIYQWYAVGLIVGGSRWSSRETDENQMPYCSVGAWDNGDSLDALGEMLGLVDLAPTRQMDCYFTC